MSRLKRQSKELKSRAVNGIVLSIEFFNRPFERGRADSVLIFLQYAFEMLLKSAIMQKRGTIHEKDSANSHTFRRCLGIAKSDILILSEEEARFLGALSDLRDCSMHHYHILSEDFLYQQIQSGILLFDRLLQNVFGETLVDSLPMRVLPVSVRPPMDVKVLMDREYSSIREMLQPGMRRKAEVAARIRPLLILESNLSGEGGQPSNLEVERTIEKIKQDQSWDCIFPGVSTFSIHPEGVGNLYSIRITKNEGLAVHRSNDDEGEVFGYREINYLDRWPFNEKELIRRTSIGQYVVRAMVYCLEVKADEELYKEFRIDGVQFKHYSPKTVDLLKQAVNDQDVAEMLSRYKLRMKHQKVPYEIGYHPIAGDRAS